MATSRRLKLLSIDGGGIRGLSSLVILQNIMHRVRLGMVPPPPQLEPYQYFDLIGGTSTGGIIALMLGRLRMGVQDCIDAYFRLGEEVFSDPKGVPHRQMFDESKLETAIKSIIKERLGPDNVDAPLLDPLGPDCCKVVVYTLPYSNPNSAQPKALRTYTSSIHLSTPCTIWQAARATSAAPVFFKPLALPYENAPNTTRWIDAGMKFNNPSQALRTEAGRIWGDSRQQMDYNKEVACFLSLGTGFSSIARLDSETLQQSISKKISNKISERFQVPLAAVNVMKNIISDTETTHTGLDADFNYEIYHRFNVEQGLQEVQLFEYEKLEAVQQDTENYIQSRNREMVHCVGQMARLPLRTGLLESRPDEHGSIFRPVDHADTSGLFADGDQASEEALQRRLEDLRIDIDEYKLSRKGFEKSKSYRDHFKRLHELPHLLPPLLQADILEKQGRIKAENLEDSASLQSGHAPYQNEDTENVLAHVERLTEAYERLQRAFVIYRALLGQTELYWAPPGLEYSWVAVRLAGILTIFGLRHEALLLLQKAGDVRIAELPEGHHSTQKVMREIEALQPLGLILLEQEALRELGSWNGYSNRQIITLRVGSILKSLERMRK